MELVMIFDMRAPAFGAPCSEVFAAALDIARESGVAVVGLVSESRQP